MPLTRKMLKAMGIEEEKVDQIIDEHVDIVDTLKKERDAYKSDAEKLVDVQRKLDAYEQSEGKDTTVETVLKSDYDTLKKEYDDYKAGIDAKEAHVAKEHAFRELVKAAGVSENRINSIVKVSDIDSIELDNNGKIKNAEERTKSIKSEWADFIPVEEVIGVKTANPPKASGDKDGISSNSRAREIYAQYRQNLYGKEGKD